MTWTNNTFAFGSTLSSTKMTLMHDNFTAMANGDSGAPSIQTAALAASAVTTAKIADANVTNAKLASSSVKTSNLSTGLNTISPTAGQNGITTLTGGQYCFWPTLTYTGGAGGSALVECVGVFDVTGTTTTTLADGATPTEPTTTSTERTLIAYSNTNATSTIKVRYISASPPYDPFGLGDHLLFVYVLMDKTGKPVVVWTAEDPPWANNGPTPVNPLARMKTLSKVPDPYKLQNPNPDQVNAYMEELRRIHAAVISGEISPEKLPPITQAEKNADMDLIPQPFFYDQDKYSVVLLAGDVVENLYLRNKYTGDSVADILLKDHLIIDNSPIVGARKYLSDGILASARFK